MTVDYDIINTYMWDFNGVVVEICYIPYIHWVSNLQLGSPFQPLLAIVIWLEVEVSLIC